jgi:hypothetical protein
MGEHWAQAKSRAGDVTSEQRADEYYDMYLKTKGRDPVSNKLKKRHYANHEMFSPFKGKSKEQQKALQTQIDRGYEGNHLTHLASIMNPVEDDPDPYAWKRLSHRRRLTSSVSMENLTNINEKKVESKNIGNVRLAGGVRKNFTKEKPVEEEEIDSFIADLQEEMKNERKMGKWERKRIETARDKKRAEAHALLEHQQRQTRFDTL